MHALDNSQQLYTYIGGVALQGICDSLCCSSCKIKQPLLGCKCPPLCTQSTFFQSSCWLAVTIFGSPLLHLQPCTSWYRQVLWKKPAFFSCTSTPRFLVCLRSDFYHQYFPVKWDVLGIHDNDLDIDSCLAVIECRPRMSVEYEMWLNRFQQLIENKILQ